MKQLRTWVSSLLLLTSVSMSAKTMLDPVDYVSTLVGTESKYQLSTGNTYPAVAMPWGMNFWVPQTGKNGDGWTYTYAADKIRGFKQTHQPSPWINDYGAFAIMPETGKAVWDEEKRETKLVIFPGSAAEPVEITVNGDAKAVQVYGDRVYMMNAETIIAYNFSGKAVATVNLDSSYDSFLKKDGYLFLLRYDKIDRVDFKE